MKRRNRLTAALLIGAIGFGVSIVACGGSGTDGEPSPFGGNVSADSSVDSSSGTGTSNPDGSLVSYGGVEDDDGGMTDGGGKGDANASDASPPSCSMGTYCPATATCVSSCSICGAGLQPCGSMGGLSSTAVCKTPYDCANPSMCTTSATCANNNDICFGKKCIPCTKGYDGNPCKGGGICTDGACL